MFESFDKSNNSDFGLDSELHYTAGEVNTIIDELGFDNHYLE